MVRTASELRTKIENLRTRRIEDADHLRTKRFCDPNRDLLTSTHGKSKLYASARLPFLMAQEFTTLLIGSFLFL